MPKTIGKGEGTHKAAATLRKPPNQQNKTTKTAQGENSKREYVHICAWLVHLALQPARSIKQTTSDDHISHLESFHGLFGTTTYAN